MISKDELARIAKLNNLRPWQQEKHYIQALVLTSLSEFPLAFKGGTYLWFFHKLDRFSEDLDFTAVGKLPEKIEEKISSDLKLFGIENTAKIINDNEKSISFRISAKGPLFTSDINYCQVYVDISLRESVVEKTEKFSANFPAYGLPTKIIRGMDLKEVAAEKVRAILTRDKARDIYDLDFLIKNGTAIEQKLIEKKLEYYQIKYDKKEFMKKIKKTKNEFGRELKSLIFGPVPKFNEVEKTLAKKMP